MHFVSGGAFNGKRNWVKETYPDATWVSVYDGKELEVPSESGSTLVFEGIDEWVRQVIDPNIPADDHFQQINEQIKRLIEWEKEGESRQLILIGTDISKGIVPMEKKNRLTRDVTGWIYQKLVDEAERVDTIWYGIASRLK